MDSRAAQHLGGTAYKGVDISNAFVNVIYVTVYERSAAQKCRANISNGTPPALPPVPPATMPMDIKISSWGIDDTWTTRLTEHDRQGELKRERIDSSRLMNILTSFPRTRRT
jgi:hypothetical protein